MTNWLQDFRQRFLDRLLCLLWSQWTSLGVSGTIEGKGSQTCDPEALLATTGILGVYDPRLFDEVLDWLGVNGKFLSIQRLKNILREKEFCNARSVISVVSDFMMGRHKRLKWQGLISKSSAGGSKPFFLQKNGEPFPLVGEKDPLFLRYGFIRSPTVIRGLSKRFPMSGVGSLLLRLRAFFGLNARPEIILYLLSHEGGGHPTLIASETSYAQKTVQDALVDMEQSGLIRVASFARRKDYYLVHDEWLRFFGIRISPDWVNWPVLFAGLLAIWFKICDKSLELSSEEIMAAEMRALTRHLRPMFKAAAPGLSILPEENLSQGTSFLDDFISRLGI